MNFRNPFRVVALGVALAALAAPVLADVSLLNVSYDPTRELYQDYNTAFARHWRTTNNEAVTINQSHGGSGKQARAVINPQVNFFGIRIHGAPFVSRTGQAVTRMFETPCRPSRREPKLGTIA